MALGSSNISSLESSSFAFESLPMVCQAGDTFGSRVGEGRGLDGDGDDMGTVYPL